MYWKELPHNIKGGVTVKAARCEVLRTCVPGEPNGFSLVVVKPSAGRGLWRDVGGLLLGGVRFVQLVLDPEFALGKTRVTRCLVCCKRAIEGPTPLATSSHVLPVAFEFEPAGPGGIIHLRLVLGHGRSFLVSDKSCNGINLLIAAISSGPPPRQREGRLRLPDSPAYNT